MRPPLSQRLARAFAVGFPDPAERDRVIEAAESPRVATFDDLPVEIQRLVRRLEAFT